MLANLKRFFDRNGVDLSLLVLRVGFGGYIAFNHGWLKLTSWNAKYATFSDPLHVSHPVSLALAIFGELVCGLAIFAGFRVRWFAIPALVTMLVAAFGAHHGELLGDGEHAMLYAIAWVAVMLGGAGRFSVDATLGRPR